MVLANDGLAVCPWPWPGVTLQKGCQARYSGRPETRTSHKWGKIPILKNFLQISSKNFLPLFLLKIKNFRRRECRVCTAIYAQGGALVTLVSKCKTFYVKNAIKQTYHSSWSAKKFSIPNSLICSLSTSLNFQNFVKISDPPPCTSMCTAMPKLVLKS